MTSVRWLGYPKLGRLQVKKKNSCDQLLINLKFNPTVFYGCSPFGLEVYAAMTG